MQTQKKNPKQTKDYFAKHILRFLKERKGKVFRRKEISHALKVHKNNYELFRKAFQHLLKEGKIVKAKGGHYTIGASLITIKGDLQLTRKGFGFVTDERTGEDIFIAAQNLNTALPGDLVEVQLFAVPRRGKNKEGHITKVLERRMTELVGTYHKSEYYGFVVPDNPKVYRDFYIPDSHSLQAKNGQKVVVRFVGWESSQMNPVGRITEILGFPDEPGVDVASVVKNFGLPLTFKKEIEAEANRQTLKIDSGELAGRLDLRNLRTFTIDPVDAKDFDDAISLEKLENGLIRLGVHIADVSHFVKPHSPLDREAFQRGTSIYLVDRVVPMLPEHLSNELCSLKPDEDRLTFSCLMDINERGEVVSYLIKPSVIHSQRRFSYQEAQKIIDDPNSKDDFADVLRRAKKLGELLRRKRIQQGSIDFDTPEVKFILDERGKPVDVVPVERLDTHRLIEEFMLLANQTVTIHLQKISPQKKPLPFIYRIHEKPDKEKIEKFRDFLHALGHKIKINNNLTPRDFQNILNQIKGTPDEPLVKEVALRTMMKAIYSPENLGHFGLGFKYYTHFTSPIRRYPDLVVHRLLKEYAEGIEGKRLQEINTEIKEICKHSSSQERLAMDAERQSVKIKQVEWIAGHVDEEFEGIISGVMGFGIFVETLPYLIEGLVRIEALDDDYYIFDEKTYALIGKDSGRVLRLGSPVRVRVKKVDLEQNTVDFVLLDDEPSKIARKKGMNAANKIS